MIRKKPALTTDLRAGQEQQLPKVLINGRLASVFNRQQRSRTDQNRGEEEVTEKTRSK